MSILFLDGFDHYSTIQAGRKWSSAVVNVVNGGTTPGTCVGRFSGNGWSFQNAGVGSYLSQDIAGSNGIPTVSIGTAFMFGSNANVSSPFLMFQDLLNNVQVDLRVGVTTSGGDPFGYFQTRVGGVVPSNGTTGAVTPVGCWCFIEFLVTCDAVNGLIILKVNGTTVISLTGINTRPTITSLISRVRVLPYSFATVSTYTDAVQFDDLYVTDGGSGISGFIGECRIQTNVPDADGTVNDFASVGTPSNGQSNAHHYAFVDDVPSDDDTSYVAGGSVGQRDLYMMSPFNNFNGTIYGVQLNVTHRKDDVGNRTIKGETRQSGIDYEGPTAQCLSQYAISRTLWDQNPATSAPWTLSQLNGAQFGVKVQS